MFLFCLVLAVRASRAPFIFCSQAQSCVRGRLWASGERRGSKAGSESQSLGVFSCLESQVRNAGVLAVALGSRCHRRRRGGRVGERRNWQSEGRGREHQVGGVGGQVWVQVGVGVGHPVQLELGLDLQGGERERNAGLVRVGASGCVCVLECVCVSVKGVEDLGFTV